MTEQLANLAISTLASGMDASQTTLTVATGEGAKFPSSGNFRVTVEDEIMLCTSRSGDVLTITRAQESTSAATHAISLPVAHTLTKAGLDNYLGQVSQPINSKLTDISGLGGDEGFGLIFNGSGNVVEWLPVQLIAKTISGSPTDISWAPDWNYAMAQAFVVTTGGGTLRSVGPPNHFAAYSGDGTRLVIQNIASSSITITHNGATPTYKVFKMRDGADLVLAQNESAEFLYRFATDDWREIDRNVSLAAIYQPLDSDLTAIAGLSPSNDDVIQRKSGAWTNRTMAQLIADLAALGTTFQPLDATLTALAGANWATDSLAIGTGTDTVSQVTFAANTFPAKASTGSLVAKTITDFGLSLVDDADMATARTTLGLDWVTDTVSISTGDVRLSWIWGDTPLVIMSNSGSGVLNAIGVPNNGAGTRVILITTNTIQLNHNNAGAEAELFIPTAATSYMDSGTIAEFMYDGTYWRYLAPVAGTVYVEDGAGNFAGSHNLENILASIYTDFLATVNQQFTELFALS